MDTSVALRDDAHAIIKRGGAFEEKCDAKIVFGIART